MNELKRTMAEIAHAPEMENILRRWVAAASRTGEFTQAELDARDEARVLLARLLGDTVRECHAPDATACPGARA